MRKVFFVLGLIVPMVFGSCSKDDDKGKSINVSPSTVTLYSGDTQQLVADGEVTSWKSDNEYVAFTENDGIVEAFHIGTAHIVANGPNGNGECVVTVKPKYSFKYEPFLNFGASMSEVKKAVKYEVYKEETDEITFADVNSKFLWSYHFNKNGKLMSIAMIGSLTSYPSYMSDYLKERYEIYTYNKDEKGNYSFYYGDAIELDEAKMIVDYSLSKNNITIVWLCREYQDNKSSSKKSLESLAKSFVLD